MTSTHDITVGPVTRSLPVREVKPGIFVALFNPLGDWELNEALGAELAPKIPSSAEVLVMPDGKAQAMLHVLGRISRLPTFVFKKEKKPYMKEPVLVGKRSECMTSGKEEYFYLGADDAARLSGKRALFVDDVVSTGGSLQACRSVLSQAGAEECGVMCAFTEGQERDDVICLGCLPVNDPAWMG